MRTHMGALLAAAMLVAVAAVGVAPAGSATTGLACTKLTGSATWSPPLPNSNAKAKSSITLQPVLGGCKGTPKITGGVLAVPVIRATAANCATLIATPAKIKVPAGASVAWTNGARSTLGAFTLSPAGLLIYSVSVKILGGQFAGKTLTATVQFVPVAGGCIVKGILLSKANLQLKRGTQATIR